MDPSVKHPFEAVMLRYVHDLTTEEFVNVGVLLLAPEARYAGVKFVPSWSRVTAMFPDADHVHLRRVANAITSALEAWTIRYRTELPLERESSLAQLLPRVVPPDELGMRASRAISGVTANPERTLSELFERYVGRFIPQHERPARDDNDVWRGFLELVPDQSFARVFSPYTLRGSHLEFEFPHAWKNGIWNIAQPLSFDLVDPSRIRDKATTWFGRVLSLPVEPGVVTLNFVVGLPSKDRPKAVREASKDAWAILEDGLGDRAQIWDEGRDARKLATKIVQDSGLETKPKI